MDEQQSVSLRETDGIVIATVQRSELTSDVTDALLRQLTASLDADRPARLILDVSNVRFMDSVVLGALVVLLRRIKRGNGRLALAGLSGHARKVLQVTGLEKIFETYGSAAEALDGLRSPA